MGIYATLTRKKPMADSGESPLAKVLTTLDLTALGIGGTLGVGVYVLAGEVSKEIAGPAVIISFLIAAITSIFAGLCYAEFGARVPKAGSVYAYSYVTIGEFIAFLIGWDLILEYSIGAASVAKGLSAYIDNRLGNAMGDYLTEHVPINISGFTEYPDAFAFAVTLAFSIALALGAKESSMLNNVFTMTNLAVVLYVIITGSIKANPDNWQIPAEKVPAGHGNGGFAPYGVSGIMKGAAICFYGFIGFDCIATAGEETRNPRRSMPMSIILSLTVVLLAYLGISTVLTMMLPYYEQNLSAPLPYVFERMNLPVAAHIVSYGAIFGLCASLMGSMFPLPRIIYAMSSDGLIFGWMGRINPRFHTPMYGTMFAGTLTGLLAAFLNLSQLVNMMSIGTLMAYTIVAACVLLLRYEVEDENEKLRLPAPFIRNFRSYLWNSERVQAPTRLTSILVTWGVTLYTILCILASLVVVGLNDELFELKWWAFSLFAVIGGLMIVTLILISRQPTLKITTAFTVPWVPWLPGLSILANIYLMMMLDVMTWVRFAVWVIIGLSIYFAYGIRKSVVRANVEYKKAVDEKRHEGKMFNSSQEILVPTGQ